MKSYPITFQTLLHTVKHQWKCFLAAVLVGSLLGTAGGWLYANRGTSDSAGTAQVLKTVDFSSVSYNQDYYKGCYTALFNSYQMLLRYLQKVSAETTLDAAQQAQVAEHMAAVSKFYQETLSPIKISLHAVGAVYSPPEFLDTLIAEYEASLQKVQMDLIAQKEAVDLIAQMDAPALDSGDISDVYKLLLSQAAWYGQSKKMEAVYLEKLERLQQGREKVLSCSRQMDAQLTGAVQQLNTLIEAVNQTMLSIAEKNHLNVSIIEKTKEDSISHTHDASEPKEAFLVMMIFCSLSGICVGAFLAVCKEAAESKKGDAQQATPVS